MVDWIMSIICYASLYGGAIVGAIWLYEDFKRGEFNE